MTAHPTQSVLNHLDPPPETLRQLLQLDKPHPDTITPEEERSLVRVREVIEARLFLTSPTGHARLPSNGPLGADRREGHVAAAAASASASARATAGALGIPGDLGLHDTPGDPLGAVHGAPQPRLPEQLADLVLGELGGAPLLLLPAAGGHARVEHELDDGAARVLGRRRRRGAGGDVVVRRAALRRAGAGGGGLEPGPVVYVALDEATLLLRGRVGLHVAGVRGGGVVVVVGPLGEVVCELEAGEVGRGVFEVDDDELFVFVLGVQEG